MINNLDCRHYAHNCKQNSIGHAQTNGAGQSMQTADHKQYANWLVRWTLTMALVVCPVWALAQSDLVMTAVGATNPQVNTLGGYVNVSDTLKNQGATASTVNVRVGYYLSTDDIITTDDTLLGYRNSGALAAGASYTNPGSTYALVPAGMAPGTYYLGAIADHSGLEAESDETNNGLAGLPFTVTLADLTMTAVGSTVNKINTLGGYITVSDTIKNQAAVASTAQVRVGYYLSTDNVITTADTLLGYRSSNPIAAGASYTNPGSTYALVPADMAPGTYYLGAIADHSGLEAESDETNNGLAGQPFTVTLADLTMTAVGSTVNKINTLGGYITVSDTVTNQAAVASTATVRVGYYLSTDNVITTADTLLGYRNSSVLAAGASYTNPGSTYALVPAGMTPGTYYLGAIADHSGLEAESDETNNGLAGQPFNVTLADFTMTAVGATVTKASAGSYISVSDTIKNLAPVASTAQVRVGFYLSTDNVITTADTLLGYRNSSVLAAGASYTNPGSTYAYVPAGMAPGTYYLGAIADYFAQEAESNETNNALVGQTIAVGPDLVMTTLSTTSTAAIPGTAINIADSFTNQGAAATTTGCRPIGYYLSADNLITTTDTLIGSRQQCGALAVSASNTVAATSVTIPAATAIGTYYLGAIVDYTNTEAEAVETNNSLSSTATLLLANLPAAPANVTAIGGHTKATVSFNASTNNGGADISGYTVISSPAGGVDTNAGSTGLSHVITGLANGTAYTFTVKATNVVGTGLASTASNSVTPAPTAPEAPANVAAVSGHTKATVSFTAPEANGSAITGYTVTSSPAGGVDGNAGSTGLSHVVTGLTNGTAYTFTVTATNSVGTSAASQPSNSIIPAPTAPDAPDNVRAAGGDSQARISFNAPPENGSPISSYTATSNPGGITASGTGSPITVTGLTNGAAYTFTVTATNGIGTSDPSQPSNSIIAMVLPQMYYIHADHLSSPRQITDTSGNIVWDWQNSDPFGNNPPNENPSGQGQFTNNLRFAGQYFDKETGLHQNRFRDYDPANGGRYIESDPIGLRGGINTYAYVRNNPLRWIDPLGLDIFAIQVGIAIPFTGGFDVGFLYDTNASSLYGVPIPDVGAFTTINKYYDGLGRFKTTVGVSQTLGGRCNFDGTDAQLNAGFGAIGVNASGFTGASNTPTTLGVDFGPQLGVEADLTHTTSWTVGDIVNAVVNLF